MLLGRLDERVDELAPSRRSRRARTSSTIASPSRAQPSRSASRDSISLSGSTSISSAGHSTEPEPDSSYPSTRGIVGHAHRQPRPLGHRGALRARPRRAAWSRSPTSATTPPRPLGLPRLTRSVHPGRARPRRDRRPRSARSPAGARPLYELDEPPLARARARPDRHPGAVRGLRRLLRRRPRGRRAAAVARRDVLSLDPKTPGRGARRPRARWPRPPARPSEERACAPSSQARLERVCDAVEAGADAPARRRPRVARPALRRAATGCPEMIELAGGASVARRGRARRRGRSSWDELVGGRRPDVVVVMPCGLYAEEAARAGASATASELERPRAPARSTRSTRPSSFSRPGPRLVDGVELLGHLLHPDRVDRRRRAWPGETSLETGAAALRG